MRESENPQAPVVCSQCGGAIYPRPISVTAVEQEFRVDVDEQGRCAVCRWDDPKGGAA